MNEDKSAILTQNEQKVFDHGYAMGKADAYEQAFNRLADIFSEFRDNQFLGEMLTRQFILKTDKEEPR